MEARKEYLFQAQVLQKVEEAFWRIASGNGGDKPISLQLTTTASAVNCSWWKPLCGWNK
jgi:hypothetical protein